VFFAVRSWGSRSLDANGPGIVFGVDRGAFRINEGNISALLPIPSPAQS
jgi:hypothetical protein